MCKARKALNLDKKFQRPTDTIGDKTILRVVSRLKDINRKANLDQVFGFLLGVSLFSLLGEYCAGDGRELPQLGQHQLRCGLFRDLAESPLFAIKKVLRSPMVQ